MKQLDNETVRQAAAYLTREIERLADGRPLRFMEVCGTHTVAIFRNGIRQLLPECVELVSGPGCPVCVTPNAYLDTALAYSRQADVTLATFGDMLRVPGSAGTLAAAKAAGADIRIVYSPLEALNMAAAEPARRVIFLAVGFETTAPTAAATVWQAAERRLSNFAVLSAHKLVPPALRTLLQSGELQLDGLLLPGHVSAMIGLAPYRFIAEEFTLPAVVGGFDGLDILQAVYQLVKQRVSGEAYIDNQYRRSVPEQGNPAACALLDKVYEPAAAVWRGLGRMEGSGLVLREAFAEWDALKRWPVTVPPSIEPAGCRCGEVLQGRIKPTECPLFGRRCTPLQPVGACMVSVEGTCAAWYKYGKGRWTI